jgi:hypothetical protein
MTDDQVEKIERLAAERRMNASELLRHLIESAVEREERQKIYLSFCYLAGKLEEAVHMLVMDDSDETLGRAFAWVGLGAGFSRLFPNEEMKQSYREVLELSEPSDEDKADPDAHELGSGWVRARRMSADERARFKRALLSVVTSIAFYSRQ